MDLVKSILIAYGSVIQRFGIDFKMSSKTIVKYLIIS